MNLKEAQTKLSSDISNLYETYHLISNSKQYFNELDVALLQQQLLYIYHSLLRVQNQLTQLPATNITELVAENKPVEESNHIESPTPVTTPIVTPVVTEEPAVETTPLPVMEEEPEPEKIVEDEPKTVASTLFDIEPVATPKVPEPQIDTPEPTLEDLEKLMKEQEAKEEALHQAEAPLAQPTTALPTSEAPSTESTLSLLDKLTATIRTAETHEKTPFAPPTQSLKQAINLNKKIAFVNNLFNENTVEYAKAIEKLNGAGSYHEALRYFTELKHQYNWNNENALVKDLETLIEKRFA